jgi:outer membrane protein TolC
MTRKNLKRLLPALLLLVPAGARAETLTLDQCVAAALKNNPEIASADYEVEASFAKKQSAEGAYSPRLRLEAGIQRWNKEISMPLMKGIVDACPDCAWIPQAKEALAKPTLLRPQYTWSTSATLAQPIGALWTIKEADTLAGLGVDVAKIQRLQNKQTVAFKVTEAYYRLLQATRMAEIAQKSVEQVTSQVKKAKTFFERGVVARNDLLRANLGLAAAEQRLIQAKGMVILAQGQLATLMGRGSDGPFEIQKIDDENIAPSPVLMEKAEQQATTARLELKEVALRIGQAESAVRLAKSKMIPSLSAVGNASFGSKSLVQTESFTWFVGATATWDIWEGGSTYRGIDEAKAKMAQALSARRKAEDMIRLDARAAHVNLTTSAESLDVAKSAVEQAEENFRMEQKRYENASNTSFDVLDAETQLTTARGQHQAAIYDFLIAKSNLARAMGDQHPALKDAP